MPVMHVLIVGLRINKEDVNEDEEKRWDCQAAPR